MFSDVMAQDAFLARLNVLSLHDETLERVAISC